jgi:hypothetical protein
MNPHVRSLSLQYLRANTTTRRSELEQVAAIWARSAEDAELRDAAAFYLARDRSPAAMIALACELPPGRKRGILSAIGALPDADHSLAALLVCAERGDVFDDSSLNLAFALWGRHWADVRLEGGVAQVDELIVAAIDNAASGSSVRARSFLVSAAFGAAERAIEHNVELAIPHDRIRWLTSALAGIGIDVTVDGDRLSRYSCYLYGCVAKDPQPLFDAWKRCVSLHAFHGVVCVHYGLDIMRLRRGALTPSDREAITGIETAMLSETRVEAEQAIDMILDTAFLRLLPDLERYCGLVLSTQPQGSPLRATATGYLAKIDGRREWISRKAPTR